MPSGIRHRNAVRGNVNGPFGTDIAQKVAEGIVSGPDGDDGGRGPIRDFGAAELNLQAEGRVGDGVEAIAAHHHTLAARDAQDFAALAAQYSEDTGSKAQGGELGWFGKGRMVAEFEDAAFKMQPGQVSDPVQTQFGYHLIKLEERDPARTIDEFTLQQKKYEAYQKWLSDLKTAAKIERNWTMEKIPPTMPGAATS